MSHHFEIRKLFICLSIANRAASSWLKCNGQFFHPQHAHLHDVRDLKQPLTINLRRTERDHEGCMTCGSTGRGSTWPAFGCPVWGDWGERRGKLPLPRFNILRTSTSTFQYFPAVRPRALPLDDFHVSSLPLPLPPSTFHLPPSIFTFTIDEGMQNN